MHTRAEVRLPVCCVGEQVELTPDIRQAAVPVRPGLVDLGNHRRCLLGSTTRRLPMLQRGFKPRARLMRFVNAGMTASSG